MKPSRKHKILRAQGTKDENRELREAVTRQGQELEQKNRELEIEASLEKVRARAMAMQSSTELADLIALIHTELMRLDINLMRSFIVLYEPSGDSTWWIAGKGFGSLNRGYHLPNNDHPPHKSYLASWRKQDSIWHYVMKGSIKKRWDNFIFKKTELAELPKTVTRSMTNVKTAFLAASFNKYGCISAGGPEPPTKSTMDLLVRFSKLFEQTYTRFLDLQKAEAQAREAQIEAALEKVRSSSLAMHQSDELQKVVSVLFNKLEDLGLAFDATLIYIFDKGKKSISAWIASSILSSPVKVNLPYDDGMARNQVIKDLWRATETGENMFNKVYSGKAKNDYILHSYKHNQSSISKATKNLMIKARGWTVSFAAERNSVVGFDSWSGHVTSEEDFRIVKRFSKVFEQAYTRFLDLKRAEAQARESQIQLALERVRARTMAMQRTDELQDAANLLLEQVQLLQIPVWGCGYNIWEKGKKFCIGWMSTYGNKQPSFKIPLTESPTFIRFYKSRQKNEDFYVEKVEGKALAAHYKYMFSLPDFARIGKEHLRTGFSLPKSQINNVANFAHGNLIFITGEPVPDAWDIFKRFAKVFEQTYARFLDLQKAEAQAREAQIEAALEKVRSRSMGMQKSSELREVVATVFQQLQNLGFNMNFCNIILFDPISLDAIYWLSFDEQKVMPEGYHVPYSNHPLYQYQLDAWRNEASFAAFDLSGKSKASWDKYISNLPDIRNLSASIVKAIQKIRRLTLVSVATKNGLVQTGGTETPSNETVAILQRFAKVFDQTYTRFLDLQKAEAQAREAQIEVALEKIRSRSLAMHSSNELSDVIGVVFSQLNELKVLHSTVGIQLFDFNTKDSIIWPRNTLQGAAPKVMLPFDEAIMNADTCHRDLWQAMSTGKTIFNKVYTRKQKDRWFKYIFANNSLDVIWESSRKTILQCEEYTVCFIPEKYSALIADSFDGSVYTDEEFMVLKRAAKVFEQAYIRFLDLQKAEEQAREAQIEAALERVRSRTMAMQKSEDLNDVAVLLFQQVAHLGIKTWTTGFNVWSDDGNAYTDYITSPQGNLIEAYTIDASQFPVFVDIANARRSGVDFWISYLEGDLLKETYSQLANFDSETQYDKMLEDGSQFPAHQYNHFVFGSKVSLMFITYDAVPEAHDIFKRFGKVFEQTYTRFLDLKTAEAQTRESQIQLALERVRARTMAMQKSDELKEVASLLFTQVKELGISCWTTGFNVWSDDGDSYVDYVTNPVGEFMEPYTVDTTRYAMLHDVAIARKRGDTFYVQFESGEDIIKTYQYLQEFGDKKQFQQILDSGFQFPTQQVDHFVFGVKSSLLFITYDQVPEAHDIFKRFGKAFEQTYTRFLDLQRAEAQAREALIESALEKVRSTSLAMHHSNELEHVVNALLDKLVDLGLHFDGAGINIFDREKRRFQVWVASKFLSAPIKVNVPFDKEIENNTIVQDLWRALDTGEHVFNRSYSGKAKNDYFRFVEKHNESRISAETGKHNLEADSWTVTFTAEKNSVIAFDSWSGQTTSEEDFQVLKRFARVFEQAYVRFLDLQKAEAQTRESQIQLALERLRARTMAMHYTLELSEVAEVLFTQLKDLGASLWGCGFNICKADDEYVERWMCRPDGKMMEPLMIPISIGPFEQLMYNAWKDGTKLITYEEGGAELQEAFESLRLHPSTEIIYKRVIELTEAHIVTAPTLLKHYVATYKYGYLWVMTTEEFEETQIFIRFAKVFEQTYTRFLDLKRAELQTREAQIEAALERVRSRTMAMHKSEELLEVITIVCEQLQHVDLEFGTVSFGKNSISFDMEFWVASPDLETPIKISAPYSDISIYNRLRAAHQERRNFFTDTFSAEEIRVWYQHLIDHNPSMFSQKSREYLLSRQAMTRSVVLLKNVFLFIINHDIVTYTDDENEIMIRFANVFEQAYTRFLDLQKAEAQAREAQIEAVLERLRARTMAMQRSMELTEVSQLLHQQFHSLGVQTITCAFMFPDEEKNVQTGWTVLPDGTLVPKLLDFPLVGDDVLNERYESWKEKKPLHRRTLEIEENRRHHQFLSERVASHISKDIFTQLPDRLTFTNANFAQGYLMLFTTAPLSADEENILVRFAKVFEQTYTRFQDLERAEAQTRESQIQLALERVRARTMAMHQSKEVREVAMTMSDQLLQLGFEGRGCTIVLIKDGTGDMEWWMGGFDESRFHRSYFIKNFDHPVHRAMLDGFIQGEKFKALRVSGELKRSFDDGFFIDNGFQDLPDNVKGWMRALESADFSIAYNKHGGLHWAPDAITDEQAGILQRFASVFEQTYTRFLDLKNAEAQAREAQIEAALEKIRSRSLAMHHSGELKDVVAIMFERMKELNVVIGTIAIQLFDQNTMNCIFWAGNKLHNEPPRVKFPYDEKLMQEDGYMKDCWEVKMKGENLINREYAYEQKIRFFDYVFASNDLTTLSEADREGMRQTFINAPNGHIVCLINEKNSSVFADSWNGEFYGEESIKVLSRAAKVFEQAYVRFLDLQKAEAQARESQIEAVLERVRAKAMSMHTAQQLKDVVHELRKQMGLLGQKGLDTCVIHLNDESPDHIQAWSSIRPPDNQGEIQDFHLLVPKRGLKIIEETLAAYSANRQDYVMLNDGEKVKQWMEFMRDALPTAYTVVEESTSYDFDNMTVYWSCADFPGGTMLMVTVEPPEEESRSLLRRFSNVFGLAYRRFADLKKAEAQAREASIEAALEKIRSRSLGMHKSGEIKDVVSILFDKLKELGLEFDGRASIHLFSEGSKDAYIWVVSHELPEPVRIDLPFDEEEFRDNPTIIDVWQAKETGAHIINRIYSKKEKDKYFRYVFKYNGDKLSDALKESIISADNYTVSFIAEKNSLLGATSWSEQKFSENDVEVLKRVAHVFEQAYIRFLDLQKAEIHAKEAVRQASLDRVRAEIASMRTVQDLDRITPLIWSELTALGVPFIRCGVFIMDETNRVVHSYLSTPEGKAIAVFQLPFYTYDFVDINLEHWREKKMNTMYWDEAAMRNFGDILVNQGVFTSTDQYLATSPKEGFYQHFLPFAQGMLYVGNISQLKDDELNVLQSLANAFATAYARYDDFNKLEEAKQQVDNALVELKQTQQQLVQSEKMASLGQLTAGIAHEIQNPLNFVNNFSEVSNELIEEMKTELEAGNIGSAAELAKDIKQNLEKITHHGKRADGIVKGMLQHSRAGSGHKELTDINLLCDEFLRLAYHGFRAKDKSFNTKFESHFDESIPKINVMSQDIGRVILNLINNGFYAVSQKSKSISSGYSPILKVCTKAIGEKVEIRVEDNGPGIAESIKDKIFQPFFTTKPTGQGTGLGLSLSYDIIKAHGGTLMMNSKEGEGTEFIVQLPV